MFTLAHRNTRSSRPESVFKCSGISVQVPSEQLFKSLRNQRSSASRIRIDAGMRLPLAGTFIEKLRTIEAPHAGTKVNGEREAARRGAEGIRERLAEVSGREEDRLSG